jgi:ArsR family transcriptional regulator
MGYRIDILKALGDETRLNIILALLKKENSVLEIVSQVKKSQPNVSIGLKKLESAGLIAAKKEGKKVIYRIKDRARIMGILEQIKHG